MLRSLSGQWFAVGLVALISMLVSLICGRTLGVDGFADFSYVVSIIYIYLMVIEGGYRALIFREESREGGAELDLGVDDIARRFIGHLILAVIAGMGLVFVMPLMQRRALIFGVIFMGFSALSDITSARIKGRGDFVGDAVWQVVVRSMSAVGMLSGLFLGRGKIAFIFAGGTLGMLPPLILPFVKRILPLPSFAFSTRLYKQVLMFLAIDAATQIYFRSDIVVLKYLCPDSAQVGNYAAASRLIGGVVLLLSPLGAVFFRHLRVIEKKEHFYRLLQHSVIIVSLVGIVVSFTIYSVAGPVVEVTFGQEYAPAASMLSGLAVALLFMFPNTILTQAAIACNLEFWYAIAAVGGAFLNVLLNIALIPSWGAAGAIIATVLTEIFLCIFLVVVLWLFSGRNIKFRRHST